jgi:hypothetical protein
LSRFSASLLGMSAVQSEGARRLCVPVALISYDGEHNVVRSIESRLTAVEDKLSGPSQEYKAPPTQLEIARRMAFCLACAADPRGPEGAQSHGRRMAAMFARSPAIAASTPSGPDIAALL